MPPFALIMRAGIFIVVIAIGIIGFAYLIQYLFGGRLKGKLSKVEAAHMKDEVKGNLEAAKVYKKTNEEIKGMMKDHKQ